MMLFLFSAFLPLLLPPASADDVRPESHARPSYVGPKDRFWRHHVARRELVVDGVDHFETIGGCLRDASASDALTPRDEAFLKTALEEHVEPGRTVGRRVVDGPDRRWGNVMLVEIRNAIHPVQVKAVRRLAHCVRTHLPQYYEVRAMYKEFNLDEDPGDLGGNTPTHLLPFLQIFLPGVDATILSAVRFAYDRAGWSSLTIRDLELGKLHADPDVEITPHQGAHRAESIPMPEELGFRASEHLVYDHFKEGLGSHKDGEDTAYTVNFAFAAPDDYEGGYLWVQDNSEIVTKFKPDRYSCVVFLGGYYNHGVTPLTGTGRREMFSNELWFNPDVPLGNTLWNSNGDNMDGHIRACNAERNETDRDRDRDAPCDVDFTKETFHGVTREEIIERLERRRLTGPVAPLHYAVPPAHGQLPPGTVMPLYWNDGTYERLDDDEAFAIGLPPELLTEFRAYVRNNGMLDLAKKLLYEHDALDESTKFERGTTHKLYTLNDGQTWGTMRPEWTGMDMIWIDPGDEECFESMLNVLRRGNFDTVLNSVGKLFDLDGLMVQGIGPIFLSHFDHDPEYRQIHHDLIEAKGAFYNVIVPIHIPESGAELYVGDGDRNGKVSMQYHVGTLLGAGTKHGTAECDYRPAGDVRLSVAIYLADVNDDNVEIIASDSTSLWPSEGDTDWFSAQRGRLWDWEDPTVNLKNDGGRAELHAEDHRDDCGELTAECIDDPDGVRLQCAETCRVYLADDEYYETVRAMVNGTYEHRNAARGGDAEEREQEETAGEEVAVEKEEA